MNTNYKIGQLRNEMLMNLLLAIVVILMAVLAYFFFPYVLPEYFTRENMEIYGRNILRFVFYPAVLYTFYKIYSNYKLVKKIKKLESRSKKIKQ